jgi:DNA-binding beta-propeller fold protein YncE
MRTSTIVAVMSCLGVFLLGDVIGYAEDIQFEHVLTIGSEGSGPGQFKYVEDFAFDKDGRLLVTDAANSTIQVFDKTTGAYIAQFGGKGDDDEHFEKPEGIAVAPNGEIFVADYATGYIKKFDAQHTNGS